MSALFAFFPEAKSAWLRPRRSYGGGCPIGFAGPIQLRGPGSGRNRLAKCDGGFMHPAMKGVLGPKYEQFEVMAQRFLDAPREVVGQERTLIIVSDRSRSGNPLGDQIAGERLIAAVLKALGTGVIIGWASLIVTYACFSHDMGTTCATQSASHTVRY